MVCLLERAASVRTHAYARGRVRVCVCLCASCPGRLQMLSGMVAHLQTFHAVVDAGCRDAAPLECSVRSDELPVSMRMRMCVVM